MVFFPPYARHRYWHVRYIKITVWRPYVFFTYGQRKACARSVLKKDFVCEKGRKSHCLQKLNFRVSFFFTPNPCDFHIFLQKLVVIFINQIITLSHKRRTDTNFLCFFFLNILFRFISIYTTRALNVKVMYVILSVGFCDRG